jgi:hypothetical protein
MAIGAGSSAVLQPDELAIPAPGMVPGKTQLINWYSVFALIVPLWRRTVLLCDPAPKMHEAIENPSAVTERMAVPAVFPKKLQNTRVERSPTDGSGQFDSMIEFPVQPRNVQ